MSTGTMTGVVAVVTGAGRGLGRSHALRLAATGAAVVVNDADPEPCAGTVELIRDAGGSATAAPGRVDEAAEASSIVDVALTAYGRVDVVINNAGLLRDRIFGKMSFEEWKAVVDVHLDGAFHVTHAAWPHLVRQGSGSVVFTTSHSGLFGSVGQANYSAAKMALVGLTATLAQEGARHGIRVNCIAPLAGTRLAAASREREVLERLDPASVSAVVAYLADPACPHSGLVLAVAGQLIQRYRVAEGDPLWVSENAAEEEIAAAVSKIGADDVVRLPAAMSLAELMEPPGGAEVRGMSL